MFSATKDITWRFGLGLILAFAVWTVLAGPLMPFYACTVVPVAQWVVQGLRPHGLRIVFTNAYPDAAWQVSPPFGGIQGRISFQLLAYNLILYLALLSAVPGVTLGHRFLLLLTGLPVFWVFHVADLLLTVESRLLTHLRPEGYAVGQHLDPYFLLVKFCASFSVMALKQVFPAFVLMGQRYGLKKFAARGNTAKPHAALDISPTDGYIPFQEL